MTPARPSLPRADRAGTLLDWRFLLPTSRLGRIAVLGTPPAGRRAMLDALVPEAEIAVEPAAGSKADGVVVFGLDPGILRRARQAVTEDGWIYVETSARRRHRGPRSIRSALQRAGFTGVRVYWHWPAFTVTDEIIPLEDPVALAAAFSRRRRSGLRGLLYGALAALGRTPILAPLASQVSAVATANHARPPVVASVIGEHRERLGLDAPAEAAMVISYLTPRYGTSRNVIALARLDRGQPVVAVVKLPRDTDLSLLRREYAALQLLEGHAPTIDHVPRALGIVESPGRECLVETAVPGRLIGRRDLLHDPEDWVDRVAAWSASLARLPESVVAPTLARGIDDAVDILAQQGLADPQLEGFAARCRALLDPLAELELPAGLEHGDLAPPNLLVTRAGALGVVDWELAAPSRFPLHDLGFFITHVAWELRTDSHSARLRSVRDVLLEPSGWGAQRMMLAASNLQLDPRIVPLVLLASWTRTAAQTLERVSWSATPGSAPVPGRVEWIRNLRALAVWRMGVVHLDHGAA